MSIALVYLRGAVSLRLGKQRHQFPRLPVEILSVQTVPIIHSVPSVTTQVHVFCHLRSGDLSFLFAFFYCSGGKFCLLHLILSVLMLIQKPSGQNICMM